MKFLKYMKVLPNKVCITQHNISISDFTIKKVKGTKRKFVTCKLIWKLHNKSLKSDFSTYANKYKEIRQEDASVEGY